jgi:hypothetical protein
MNQYMNTEEVYMRKKQRKSDYECLEKIVRIQRYKTCTESTHRSKYISNTWIKVHCDPDNDDEYSNYCQILNYQTSWIQNCLRNDLKFILHISEYHQLISTFLLIGISKQISFLLDELGGVDHRQFCRASFAASFYHRDKFLNIFFNNEKLITQIESGLLDHPLCRQLSSFIPASPHCGHGTLWPFSTASSNILLS